MIKPITCKFDKHKYLYVRNNTESFIQYRVCKDCGKVQERYFEFHKPEFIDSNKWKIVYVV
jgi:hypothetical protein